MNKRRIAVAVAALFLGAQVGIAALEPEAARSPETEAAVETAEQHASEYSAATSEVTERAESATTTESTAAAEQPEAAESTEPAEQSASAEPAEAVSRSSAENVATGTPAAPAQPEPAAQQPVPAVQAAPEQPATWWDKVRAAFASLFEQVRIVIASATPAPTFPDGDGSSAWHLPATIAYLDRVEQERTAAMQPAVTSAVANEAGVTAQTEPAPRAALTESAFPMGADETTWREPMAAELAYFERIERERLAKETRVQTAQADTATVR